jgi:hypothetical protein
MFYRPLFCLGVPVLGGLNTHRYLPYIRNTKLERDIRNVTEPYPADKLELSDVFPESLIFRQMVPSFIKS